MNYLLKHGDIQNNESNKNSVTQKKQVAGMLLYVKTDEAKKEIIKQC